MLDTRAVLDAVRGKVPPTAKLLVVWQQGDGALHCAQANTSLGDIDKIAASLQANAAADKLKVRRDKD